MGKVIRLKPPGSGPKLVQGPRRVCPHCRHNLNVHITHPDGTMSCAARGCPCKSRPLR
ncbi:MAG TPA: hypothetical protein VEF03_08830 [Candidatus Binataceae bacterium]|nr:hypothetical protein [Candidatus Binataceae bacterium]